MLGKLLAGLFTRSDAREGASAAPQLSVIICSIDDERYARVSANLRERLRPLEFELIRIDDAKSLAEGYNRGLKRARAPLLIFCHDDIELLQPDFGRRLMANMESLDMLGVAGSTRLVNASWGDAGVPDSHGQVLQPLKAAEGGGCVLNAFCQHDHGQQPQRGAQSLDGLFIAVRRKVAESLLFDAATFDGFHLYDVDFSFRAHLAGYRVGVCHDILIYHHSTGDKDAVWAHYSEIFQRKFAEQLSCEPAGPPLVYQVRVADKAEGLQAFERVMRKDMVFR